jgi:hypothetical protein
MRCGSSSDDSQSKGEERIRFIEPGNIRMLKLGLRKLGMQVI